MKDNTKIILYSCFTMILAFLFAMTISFKAINSSKAGVLGPSDSNLTYNEGQTLINSTGSTTNGREYLLQIYYGGSSTTTSTSNRYSFTYSLRGNMLSTTTSDAFIHVLKNCTFASLTNQFTCPTYAVIPLTSTSISTYDLSENIDEDIIITLRKSDIQGNETYGLTFSRLPYGSNLSSSYLFSNVVFGTANYSYSDGYNLGLQTAKISVFNELYYMSCMTSVDSQFTCPTNYYSSSAVSSVPSIERVLSDISSFRGLNNTSVPIELFNYLSNANSDYFQQCQLSSTECVVWEERNYSFDGLKSGVDVLISNLELINNDGSYNVGYTEGYEEGNTIGYNQGYGVGYDLGLIEGTGREDILGNAVISIASTPLTILSGMLNFNILGFNVFGLVLSLFTLMLVIWVIKKVLF